MHKHILSFFLFSLLWSFSGSAQQHGIDQAFGLLGSRADVSGLARMRTDTSMLDVDYSVRVKQIGIVYAIRKDLVYWKWGSISIGSPLMLGVSYTNRYRSYDFNGSRKDTVQGKKGTHIAFEIPVVADLNIGLHAASDDTKRSLGFYLGVGYQYSFTKLYTSAGKVPYDRFDPIFRTGIRMGHSWETRWSLGFNVRGTSNTHRTYSIHWVKEL